RQQQAAGEDRGERPFHNAHILSAPDVRFLGKEKGPAGKQKKKDRPPDGSRSARRRCVSSYWPDGALDGAGLGAPEFSAASRAALSPASCAGSSLGAPPPGPPPWRAVPLSSAASCAAVSPCSCVAPSLDLGAGGAALAAGVGVVAALATIVLAP